MEERYCHIEDLLNTPYWVVDLLPEQVPAGSPGQYFEIERYYLEKKRLRKLHRRFLDILLKLNCFFDIEVCGFAGVSEGCWEEHPAPGDLARLIKNLCAPPESEDRIGTVNILFRSEDALVVLNNDDLCMTVYHPTEKLLQMLKEISAAAGLFVWQPIQ